LKSCLSGAIWALSLLLWGMTGHAYDLTLAWDPNSEPDLEGYVLYLSIDDDDAYTVENTILLDTIDPGRPRVVVTGLDDDIQYYFVVTAFNTEGLESGFSNELCVENGQLCTANGSGGGDGSSGGGCFAATLLLGMP